MDYHLKLRYGKYIGQSLVHYGIMIQNNQYINVSKRAPTAKQYTVIHEGILFAPSLYNKIRTIPNVEVYKNNNLVFKKVTDNSEILTFTHDVFDLYDTTDKQYVDNVILHYENNRKIYLENTELVQYENNSTTLAGLASGNILTKLSYQHKLEHVIFFDYSVESLEFQKTLITSKDRKQAYIDNINIMTLGDMDARISDLDRINFDEIEVFYDYLNTIKTEFIQVDFRNNIDINKLFDLLPKHSSLWISNVLHYLTTLNDYSIERYDLIDRLSTDKNIRLLPHTRVYYES